MIEMVVNLLKHRNPYTGRTYAEEAGPVLHRAAERGRHFLLHVRKKAFNACPDVSQSVFLARFAAWLKERYGSQEEAEGGLGGVAAAGRDAGGRERRAAAEPVVLRRRPPAGPEGRGRGGGCSTRPRSCTDVQDRFYSRFCDSHPRRPGLPGPTQRLAVAGAEHGCRTTTTCFSDYKVGFHRPAQTIFEGKGPDIVRLHAHPAGQRLLRQRLAAGARPGRSPCRSGSTSTRTSTPAEGPAIVAAYGMGLQGWDASLRIPSAGQPQGVLATHRRQFPLGRLGRRDVPTSLGQFPRAWGADDLPRRRQGRARVIARAPCPPGRPWPRGRFRLLRQGGAARAT